MQPLDTSVFASLKTHWCDTCHQCMQKNPDKVITKYKLSSLLAEAWFKAMTQSTVIKGFKHCGVYLFNKDIVLDRNMHDTTCTSDNVSSFPVGSSVQSTTGNTSNSHTPRSSDSQNTDYLFSPQEEERFQKCYEEGYDLFDLKYVSWIEINHPENSYL